MTRDPEYEREVAERAYVIYLARGGTDGLAEEDWFQAEAELAGEVVPASGAAEGPNVPVASEGRGERASDVMPDVKPPDRGGEPEQLPPGP